MTSFILFLWDRLTHKAVEDVSLMHVNRDERLEFSSFDLGEVTCRLVDERVEEFEEGLVSGRHCFLVVTSILQCFS